MRANRPLPAPSLPLRAWPVPVCAAILVAATLLAYWPTLAVGFFFDDLNAIVLNPTIRQLGNLRQVLSPPADGGGVTGRPLINLSLAINYALGGTAPRGYHAFNLLLHAAATLALFGVVRRTLLLLRGREVVGPPATPFAFWAALLWSLHPLQTESVGCVIQRTELLVGLFFLLTLYAFARGLDAPRPWRWWIAALVSCLLGMASKEVMVAAPLLVLLYDRTFAAGSFASAWRLRRSWHLALASTWILLAFLVLGAGGSRGTSAGFGLGISAWSYLLKQCEAIVLYLRLSLWPHPLVIDYGNAVITSPLAVLPQGLLLLVLAGLTVILLVRRPVVGFLGLCFFSILAPSSSVVPLLTQTMAEHRMYLPLAAVIALLLGAWHRYVGPRWGPIALVAIALGTVTHGRSLLLGDVVALWRDCVAHAPLNPRAHDNLALALSQAGRPAEAIPHYQRALVLNPSSAPSRVMLGDAYLSLDRLPEAETEYRRALALAPNQQGASHNLGVVLLRTGRLPEAVEQFQRALQTETDQIHVRRNLAFALAKLGRTPEAVRHYEAALRLDPADFASLTGLGNLLLAGQQIQPALLRYRQALRQQPNDIVALTNLARALLRANQPAEAAEHCARAVALNPHFAQGHTNLGIALAQLGRNTEAIAAFERALREDPNQSEAREQLARLRPVPATNPRND